MELTNFLIIARQMNNGAREGSFANIEATHERGEVALVCSWVNIPELGGLGLGKCEDCGRKGLRKHKSAPKK